MIAGYFRVSTEKQAERYSLSTQEKLFKTFAGHESYRTYREAKSGVSVIGRPELQRLLKDIEKGEIQKLWVVELSRLGREVEDLAVIKKLLIKHKVHLYVNSVQTNLSDIDQALLYNISAAFSENERSRIAERTRRGLGSMRDDGKQTYPDVYGYTKVFSPDGKRQWVVVEDEAKVVKLVYEWFSNGLSEYAIVKKLRDMGFTTKHNRPFLIGRVSKMLRRPIYAGLAPNKEHKLIPSKLYTPIIDPALFKKINKDWGKIVRPRPYTWACYFGSAVVSCKECGAKYILHKNPHGEKFYPMYCGQHLTACKNIGNIKKEILEGCLEGAYFYMHEDLPKLQGLWEKKMAAALEEDESKAEAREQYTKQIKRLDAQKKNLVSAIADRTLGKEDAAEKLSEIKADRDKAQKQLDNLTLVAPQTKKEWDYILAAFSEERRMAFTMEEDLKKKRMMFKEVLKEATIQDYILHIEFINGWTTDINLRDLPPEYANRRYEGQPLSYWALDKRRRT